MKTKLIIAAVIISLTAIGQDTNKPAATDFAKFSDLAVKTTEAKNGVVYLQGVKSGVGLGANIAFHLMQKRPYGYYTNATQLENDCTNIWALKSVDIYNYANEMLRTNIVEMNKAKL